MPDLLSEGLQARLEAVFAAATHGGPAMESVANEARRLLVHISRPIRLTVSGEYSSGKSTLVNLLAGARLVDTSVLPTELPPTLFRYGAKGQVLCGWWGEPDRIAEGEADLAAMEQGKYDFLCVITPTMNLQSIDLVDLPGLNDPGRNDDAIIALAAQADGVIWCTNAVNAWRETERRKCSELAQCQARNAILVVTHVDLDAVRGSVSRLMRRLTAEAGSMFRFIAPVATLQAIQVQTPLGTVTDPGIWQDSGAKALFDAIKALAADLDAARTAKIVAFLESEPVATALDLAAVPVTTSPAEVLALWSAEVGKLVRRANKLAATDFAKHAVLALGKLVADLDTLPESQGKSAAWLREDLDAAIQTLDPTRPERVAALLVQIDRDLAQVLGGMTS